MARQRIAQAACILLTWTIAQVALGNGVLRDGVGAISIGRGGTNIAFADNTAVILDNPAGMVNIHGSTMWQIGADGLITDLQYVDPFTVDDAAIRPLGLPQLGLVKKSDDGTWAYGIGLVAPAGFGAQWEMDDPVYGHANYSSFGALVKVLPAFAVQVTDRLSVGGTAGVGISYANLDGPFYTQQLLPGAPSFLDVRGAGATFVWSLGVQYQLSDRTTIGATYQSESRFHLEGDAQVDLLAPLPVSSEFDATIDLTWPRTFGVGLVHCMGEERRHRLSTDLIWVNWSKSYDGLGVHLRNPSNPLVGLLLGNYLYDEFPLRWNDSLSARLGYEWFATDRLVLRTGYVYNVNQVPDGTLTPYIPAILEHGVSTGLGYATCFGNIDLAYQYSWGPYRSIDNSDLLGGDFDFSEYKAEAHWLALSYTKRF